MVIHLTGVGDAFIFLLFAILYLKAPLLTCGLCSIRRVCIEQLPLGPQRHRSYSSSSSVSRYTLARNGDMVRVLLFLARRIGIVWSAICRCGNFSFLPRCLYYYPCSPVCLFSNEAGFLPAVCQVPLCHMYSVEESGF